MDIASHSQFKILLFGFYMLVGPAFSFEIYAKESTMDNATSKDIAPDFSQMTLPAGIRAETPAIPDSDWAKDWWPKRFEQKQSEIKSKGGSQVVFFGDSITHNWEGPGAAQWKKYFADAPYRAIQLGYGGDRTEHVLWRIDHGELDGYHAKAVLLLIGTNNTGHFPFEKEPPIDTIIGIKAVVDRILEKQPHARVILTAIFPRGENNNDQGRIRNSIVNREIMKLADGKRVIWCDFSSEFLLPDGRLPREIVPDLLHPGPAGYEIWASSVMPLIDRVLAAREGEPIASVYSRFQDSASLSQETRMPLIPQTRIEIGPDGSAGWWLDRMTANRRVIAQSNGVIDLVFMGDSITHYWDVGEGQDTSTEILELKKKFTILNCGYGGDQTQHLLWRVKNGELDGYKAKLGMLLIGTNNSGAGCAPADTFAAIREIVKVFHEKQPGAKLLLLKLFPRNTVDSPANQRNVAVNKMIAEEIWDDFVIVKDLTSVFADKEGNAIPELYDGERLHMSDEGFVRWRKAVEPIFDEFCGGAK